LFFTENAFKLTKSREEIKCEFYCLLLHSKTMLLCYAWYFFRVFFEFLLVNSMGNINDNLVTCAQWPISAWHKDQKVLSEEKALTEEKAEVVSIIVNGRHDSVLFSGDSIHAETICELSRIVHEFKMNEKYSVCDCW